MSVDRLKLGDALRAMKVPYESLWSGTGRTCSPTRESLQVLTGEGEMRVTGISEEGRVTEAFRGRTCVNCGYPPFEYVPIPSRKDVVVLCVLCMEHLLEEAGRGPSLHVVGGAVEGLQAILKDTDG